MYCCTVESYDYLGLGTVVRRGHPLSGVDQSFILKAPELVGDAGDQYNGLDRFGRVVDQRWRTSSADVERTLYGYDRNGNRTSRTNSVNSAYSEAYTYDGLNQLASFDRNSGARTQSWDYDALGNWDGVTTNGSTQTRTHNKQNEITAVSGATSPTFDANGNMTTDETGKQYTYDAWNRLKVVKNSSGVVQKTYTYDALNRRVAETVGATTTDLYYSAGWQVLEERVGTATKARYVWSPVYVDAMILRDRDTDANGSLDERLWVMQDANWNVVGLVNGSGVVVERYAYDAFGAVTVMNGSWTVGSTAYGWQYLHQGGRLDVTSGLYHFRNRDYSPTLGRWVSMDPIGYSAGDTNLWRTVDNNVPNSYDPSGLAKPAQCQLGQVGQGRVLTPSEAMIECESRMYLDEQLLQFQMIQLAYGRLTLRDYHRFRVLFSNYLDVYFYYILGSGYDRAGYPRDGDEIFFCDVLSRGEGATNVFIGHGWPAGPSRAIRPALESMLDTKFCFMSCYNGAYFDALSKGKCIPLGLNQIYDKGNIQAVAPMFDIFLDHLLVVESQQRLMDMRFLGEHLFGDPCGHCNRIPKPRINIYFDEVCYYEKIPKDHEFHPARTYNWEYQLMNAILPKLNAKPPVQTRPGMIPIGGDRPPIPPPKKK
jgi:RHS repeat-associated protein